jgi:hypothetical protein
VQAGGRPSSRRFFTGGCECRRCAVQAGNRVLTEGISPDRHLAFCDGEPKCPRRKERWHQCYSVLTLCGFQLVVTEGNCCSGLGHGREPEGYQETSPGGEDPGYRCHIGVVSCRGTRDDRQLNVCDRWGPPKKEPQQRAHLSRDPSGRSSRECLYPGSASTPWPPPHGLDPLGPFSPPWFRWIVNLRFVAGLRNNAVEPDEPALRCCFLVL